jgi:hypothetical protein
MLFQTENGEIATLDPVNGWSMLSLPGQRPMALRKPLALIPHEQGFLVQAEEEGPTWSWDSSSFEAFPTLDPQGKYRDLQHVAIGGQGQVWTANGPWEPFVIYRLEGQRWEPLSIPGLPPTCGGYLVVFASDNLVIPCPNRGPVLITGSSFRFIADDVQEIDFKNPSLIVSTIPVADPRTPYVFFTVYNPDTKDEILYRYEPGTRQLKTWTIPNDWRLHWGEEGPSEFADFDEIVLDPRNSDRFLIRSSRYIARPENGTLKVAFDGNTLLATRGIPTEGFSGLVHGLDIQNKNEVWILIRELGLLRYDSIWTAEEVE